jgi:hypothetical protein
MRVLLPCGKNSGPFKPEALPPPSYLALFPLIVLSRSTSVP